MVDTCALKDIRTSQATDRSRRRHQFTVDPKLLCCGKTLGGGAQFSIVYSSEMAQKMIFLIRIDKKKSCSN